MVGASKEGFSYLVHRSLISGAFCVFRGDIYMTQSQKKPKQNGGGMKEIRKQSEISGHDFAACPNYQITAVRRLLPI